MNNDVFFFKGRTTLSTKQVHAYSDKRFAKSSGKRSSSIQAYAHSIHDHFTYPVGGKHCKRMASIYKHNYGKHSRGRGISPIWKWKSKFPSVRLLVFAHSACRHKVLCEVLPRAVNINFLVCNVSDSPNIAYFAAPCSYHLVNVDRSWVNSVVS